MGEERRRDLMASAFPVGSSAAIDFTAGEMTLRRALIAGPPTHRNAIFMCAPALPYVAACLAVAARLALGVYVFFAGSTMIRPRPRLTT